jgi:hypothetical protein
MISNSADIVVVLEYLFKIIRYFGSRLKRVFLCYVIFYVAKL